MGGGPKTCFKTMTELLKMLVKGSARYLAPLSFFGSSYGVLSMLYGWNAVNPLHIPLLFIFLSCWLVVLKRGLGSWLFGITAIGWSYLPVFSAPHIFRLVASSHLSRKLLLLGGSTAALAAFVTTSCGLLIWLYGPDAVRWWHIPVIGLFYIGWLMSDAFLTRKI